MDKVRTFEILLVDGNPGAVFFTQWALHETQSRNSVSIVTDGIEAIDFLRRQGRFEDAPRPDLVLMDLNLPRRNGFEVLAEIKEDMDLRVIPVLMLSNSGTEEDVRSAYRLHANGYLLKPADLSQMGALVRAIDSFWLSVAQLPSRLGPSFHTV